MIRRPTWILLGIFLIVALLAWIFQTKLSRYITPTATPVATQANLFSNLDVATIQEIKIVSMTGTIFDATLKPDKTWQVQSPQNSTVDSDQINQVAQQITNLTALAQLNATLAPEQIGLVQPTYTMVITGSNKTSSNIRVGALTPTSDGYYASVNNQAPIVISKYEVDNIIDILLPTPTPPADTPTP